VTTIGVVNPKCARTVVEAVHSCAAAAQVTRLVCVVSLAARRPASLFATPATPTSPPPVRTESVLVLMLTMRLRQLASSACATSSALLPSQQSVIVTIGAQVRALCSVRRVVSHTARAGRRLRDTSALYARLRDAR
jgi:hypothetical protein